MPRSGRARLKPLIAGNWKMNGLVKARSELRRLASYLVDFPSAACDVVICPPATLLHSFRAEITGTRLSLGAQDCHADEGGAHTGDISAAMVKDAGAKWVILGHSERRVDHGETDRVVRDKAVAAASQGLGLIVCLGESKQERDGNKTLRVIGRQLAASIPQGIQPKRLVIAYEPIWAIGSGRTPTLDQIAQVHGFLRNKLIAAMGDDGARVRLLYGGSVKPSNAAEILAVPHVNGALVGGASLKAGDFWQIIKACG